MPVILSAGTSLSREHKPGKACLDGKSGTAVAFTGRRLAPRVGALTCLLLSLYQMLFLLMPGQITHLP